MLWQISTLMARDTHQESCGGISAQLSALRDRCVHSCDEHPCCDEAADEGE